jgi:hypothetical protein
MKSGGSFAYVLAAAVVRFSQVQHNVAGSVGACPHAGFRRRGKSTLPARTATIERDTGVVQLSSGRILHTRTRYTHSVIKMNYDNGSSRTGCRWTRRRARLCVRNQAHTFAWHSTCTAVAARSQGHAHNGTRRARWGKRSLALPCTTEERRSWVRKTTLASSRHAGPGHQLDCPTHTLVATLTRALESTTWPGKRLVGAACSAAAGHQRLRTT